MNTNHVEKAILAAAKVHQNDRWGENPYVALLALAANQATLIMTEGGEVSVWDHEDAVVLVWLRSVLHADPRNAENVQKEFPHLVETLTTLSAARRDSYDNFIHDVIYGPGDARAAFTSELAWLRTVARMSKTSDEAKGGIEKIADALYRVSNGLA